MTAKPEAGGTLVIEPDTYRLVSWACLAMAAAHALATLGGLYLVREGNLADFSPLRFMQFIPEHTLAWKFTCLAAMAKTLSFVVFTVAFRQMAARRMRPLVELAIVLTAIGAAVDLAGQGSMMVLFSDLAHHMRSHGAGQTGEAQLIAWAVLNQALTATALVANTLYAVAGLLVMACAAVTRGVPAWLVWLGWPIWIVALAISALSFLGHLKLALVLGFATGIVFVFWSALVGITFRLIARPHH